MRATSASLWSTSSRSKTGEAILYSMDVPTGCAGDRPSMHHGVRSSIGSSSRVDAEGLMGGGGLK